MRQFFTYTVIYVYSTHACAFTYVCMCVCVIFSMNSCFYTSTLIHLAFKVNLCPFPQGPLMPAPFRLLVSKRCKVGCHYCSNPPKLCLFSHQSNSALDQSLQVQPGKDDSLSSLGLNCSCVALTGADLPLCLPLGQVLLLHPLRSEEHTSELQSR